MLNRRFAEFMAGTLLCIASIGALAQATKTTPSPAPQKQESPKVRNGIPQTWKQVPIPPLPKFSPQEPIRVALPNGLVIFLQLVEFVFDILPGEFLLVELLFSLFHLSLVPLTERGALPPGRTKCWGVRWG